MAGASLIGAGMSLVVLVAFGEMGGEEWELVVLLLPALLAGIFFGRLVRPLFAVGSRARLTVYAFSVGGALWSLATSI